MKMTTAGEKQHTFKPLDIGKSSSTIVTVPGASIGELAWTAIHSPLAEGHTLSAAVVAPNEVRVTLANIDGKPTQHEQTTITAVVMFRHPK